MFNRNASRYETRRQNSSPFAALDADLRPARRDGVPVLAPTSFLPLEDRGMFTTSVQLPSGAPSSRR
jgi:multidrug efflux pump